MESHTHILKVTKARSHDLSNDDPAWVVLVIDDNHPLLKVTHNILKNFRYADRRIQVECAHSAKDGKALYKRFPNAAIILLDCVMETEHSGLDFVRYIREEENNRAVQIILRTGQPGVAPENEVLHHHAINDYLDKSQLTAASLRARITSYLRNYENVNQLLRNKDALAGSLAHEIKNPLGQLDFSLRKIRESLPNLEPIEGSESRSKNVIGAIHQFTEVGQRAVEKGKIVVDSLLDEVVNPVSDSHRLRVFSVRDAIKIAIRDYGYQHEEFKKRIRLLDGDDYHIRADEAKFSLVLFNLFQNALYYLSEYPNLTTTIKTERKSGYGLVIIHDNGPGIAKKDIPYLFENFYTSGKAKGTGLGLPFCYRTMHLFGGSIHCESLLGECTDFILEFPIQTGAFTKQSDETVLERNNAVILNDKVFVVVDDDEINREIISDCLASIGVKVIKLESCDHLLSLLNDENFAIDGIITDLNMPDLNGVDLCRAIRSEKLFAKTRYKTIPVLAYTAEPDVLMRQKFIDAGGVGFINKPIDKKAIVNTLLHALTRGSVDDQPISGSIIEHDSNAMLSFRLAAQLHHDMTTPILTVETYGKLINCHIDRLINTYKASPTDDIPEELINKLEHFNDDYQKLTRQCRERHKLFWEHAEQHMPEVKRTELIKDTVVGYQAEWSLLHRYHVELLQPTLPILIDHCLNNQNCKKSLSRREISALLKAGGICVKCSKNVLFVLANTTECLSSLA